MPRPPAVPDWPHRRPAPSRIGGRHRSRIGGRGRRFGSRHGDRIGDAAVGGRAGVLGGLRGDGRNRRPRVRIGFHLRLALLDRIREPLGFPRAAARFSVGFELGGRRVDRNAGGPCAVTRRPRRAPGRIFAHDRGLALVVRRLGGRPRRRGHDVRPRLGPLAGAGLGFGCRGGIRPRPLPGLLPGSPSVMPTAGLGFCPAAAGAGRCAPPPAPAT